MAFIKLTIPYAANGKLSEAVYLLDGFFNPDLQRQELKVDMIRLKELMGKNGIVINPELVRYEPLDYDQVDSLREELGKDKFRRL